MKKLVVLALAVVAAAASSSAPAATTTMAITHDGYVPKTLTIASGDSVVFANQDTVAHQVVLKPTTGFTCTANLVIQPGQSSTCTFRTVTKYSVTDPNKNGAAFKGTINVTAGPPGSTLSLTAAPRVVLYGRSATLTGQLASGQANQKVDVFTQECGAAALTKLTTVSTTTGGAYTLIVQPHRNTTYQSRFRSSSSSQVLVKARPRVSLRKLAPRKFRVTVLAAESYAGKFVLFQRYSSLKLRWITVRSVVLRAGSTLTTPINPTSVSTATFRAKIRVRLRVRAYLTQAQAGSCYAASASTAIRS
ncbi:MAG TPA: cupredoxin domain-containing protein [Gaiellaceae bacterium]|jgi:plastocyanin